MYLIHNFALRLTKSTLAKICSVNFVKLKLVIESGKHTNFIHLMYKQTVLNPRLAWL